MIWIIVFVVAFFVEITTVTLISMWFCVGAVAAFLVETWGGNLPFQLITFLIISGACLWLLKPIMKKHWGKPIIKTNANALIGERANEDMKGEVRA